MLGRELSYSKVEVTFPFVGLVLAPEALSQVFLFGSRIVLCQLVPAAWVFSFSVSSGTPQVPVGLTPDQHPTLGLHLLLKLL